ncbi:rRNA N6-adenosine-methyltransferase ZCCHC4 [Scaptodrosophila lebanonensis]|uniref:rRNA N6-adenosine-methyltransferase ZCCHC4 n=1 Tax=Drosophila lebanonensis TaxID=7225 RepID=A0A6J2UGN7_DROLE|nr:rRNA N6-adenosine-methyltransferase ZCCHC4 [Scaptodrosophila lebanonensis]
MIASPVVKSDTKLQVEIEDEDKKHPTCPHGPMILFYRETPNDGYYSCSAHRDSKLCHFRIPATSWQAQNLTYTPKERDYPLTRSVKSADPTNYLSALSKEEAHAQYFFDEKALRFFVNQCRVLKISKVVCIGAPRLHFYLRKEPNMCSFLLDLDERFAAHLSPQEFCLYNMCNNHFFYSRQPFEQFLKCNANERVLVMTDPPFGCRTELIANTLRCLTILHNRLNCMPHTPLPIFWVYPYYNVNHIKQDMPEMEMCDYKINYTNHTRYTDVGVASRTYGSPVRLFSNVPQQLLQLPTEEAYKYCTKCKRYTAAENLHCIRCETCPSQNGQTYRHCEHCGVCVKPNYVHCFNCRRCSQRENHDCAVYQSMQRCWICREKGHIETKCVTWLQNRRRLKVKPDKRHPQRCFICGRAGQHNELKCPKRCRFFKEIKFMNQETTIAL